MREFYDIDREAEEHGYNNEQQGFEIPTYPIEWWQRDKIEQLLQTSCIDHEERWTIEKGFDDTTSDEAEAIISRLYDHQTDPILSGRNYSQTDIKNLIKKLTK